MAPYDCLYASKKFSMYVYAEIFHTNVLQVDTSVHTVLAFLFKILNVTDLTSLMWIMILWLYIINAFVDIILYKYS